MRRHWELNHKDEYKKETAIIQNKLNNNKIILKPLHRDFFPSLCNSQEVVAEFPTLWNNLLEAQVKMQWGCMWGKQDCSSPDIRAKGEAKKEKSNKHRD